MMVKTDIDRHAFFIQNLFIKLDLKLQQNCEFAEHVNLRTFYPIILTSFSDSAETKIKISSMDITFHSCIN